MTAVTVLVIVQGALIAWLLVAVWRRRAPARRTAGNHDVVGHLIDAHNQERACVARALQDDVSQQLAALSIAISGLKRWPELSGRADVHEHLSALQRRVTEEALRNIAAHAQARRVHLTLSRHAGDVHVSVTDDGAGFDLARAAGTNGLGAAAGLAGIAV